MPRKTKCLADMPPPRILLYPPTNSPHRPQGKFLQLHWQGLEYLIFADASIHGYHNQILAGFAKEQGLSHRWITAAQLELENPDLEVLGGGRFRLDQHAGTLELWDNSQAYGRFRTKGLAKRIAAAGPPWSDLRVSIR